MDFSQFFSPFFLLFLLKATLPPSSSPHSSTFPNNFTLHGDAHFTKDGTISLTQKLHNSVGSALLETPIRFLDPSTNSTPSFSCTFSFTITTPPSSAPGEGLAFLIASTNPSSSGRLGLPNRTTGSVRESFLAVEFDTDFDRIGLDVDGLLISSLSIGAEAGGIDLKSGKKITSWVGYQDEKKMVQIWVSHSSIKPPAPILSMRIDLTEKVLKEFMHVGFSASNGARGSALHFVESWEFAVEGLSQDDIQLNILRLIALLGLLVWLVVVVSYIRHHFSRKLKGRVPRDRLYKLTNGFEASKRVVQADYWSGYRVQPFLGKAVAIKRFENVNRASSSNFEQLAAERAANFCTLKHKNLLQLQGWCFEQSEVILIYEYVDGETLRQVLDRFSDTSRGELHWGRSVKILIQVASALAYLHLKKVFHKDVKTCNIILDRSGKAKLGELGFLHRSEPREAETSTQSPDALIRRAYHAPEYVDGREATEATDVYSFGVVVLEVATGCPPVDRNGVKLVTLDLEKLLDAAHARLTDSYDKEEMREVLELGLRCVVSNAASRLRMAEVESVLKGEVPLRVAVESRLT